MESCVIAGRPVSRIGFGCAPIGGFDYGPVDDEVSVAAIQAALDAGITFFDCADVYGFGHAEEVLGRALAGRRDEAFLATKFGLAWDGGRVRRDSSAAHFERALEASLRRLRTDRIDLMQIHWPDPATPLSETAAALDRAKSAGKIGAIGCCNFTLAQLQELHDLLRVDTFQAPLNLLCRGIDADVLPWCEQQGIAVLAHSTLARGYLAGRSGTERAFGENDTRPRSRYFSAGHRLEKEAVRDAIGAIAKSVDRTSANVAVRWVLDRGASVALIGMKTPEQVAEHLGAAGWTLADADLESLSAVSAACPDVMSGDLAR